MPAGAVYGYTAMLWKLADGLNKADGPTHMAVILDASCNTYRNKCTTSKGQPAAAARGSGPAIPADPHRDARLFDPVHRGGGAGGGRYHRLLRHRGDQAAGWKVTIVSSDKDLMQLIDDDGQVDMLDTMNDRRIGRDQVIEKFGVPPDKVGDVLALMGEAVDNMPGHPRDRAEDRDQVDPGIWDPGRGAGGGRRR